MDVVELAKRCGHEMAKSRRGQPADDCYCLELFRRAIVQRDQEAWEAVFRQYHRLVHSWIGPPHPEAEYLVNEVFARFWQKITPDEFERRFRNLGGILAYLKVCARNLVINYERRREREQIVAPLAESPAIHSPENGIIENIAGQELAAYIKSRLRDETERLVIYLSFELELKPREICKQYPHKFASAKQVSRVKERVLERLRRDPRLLSLWAEG